MIGTLIQIVTGIVIGAVICAGAWEIYDYTRPSVAISNERRVDWGRASDGVVRYFWKVGSDRFINRFSEEEWVALKKEVHKRWSEEELFIEKL